MDEPGRLERQEVEAFLETRRELGPAYDADLVDALAERIEKVVETRVAQATTASADRGRASAEGAKRQFVLGIVSLGAGIPITAISAALADVPGLFLSWLGIAAVNAAHAAAVNGPRRSPPGR